MIVFVIVHPAIIKLQQNRENKNKILEKVKLWGAAESHVFIQDSIGNL